MALPTAAQQLTLDITANGRPAVLVEAKSLSSLSLDITADGRPAVATAGAAPPSSIRPWWIYQFEGMR